jgi:hypothetical protein
MADLSSKIIKYLDREVDFTKDVLLSDDMIDGVSNPYIKEWNAKDKPKPTDAQLNALASQATALENNAKINAKRRTEYLPFEDQLEMIYKDQKNGTTTFKDHCDKVRSDNPKE